MTTHEPAHDTITSRDFDGTDDFMRVRRFLLETYGLNNKYHNWEPRRLDGQWFGPQDAALADWGQHAQIWENAQGEIVGVAHREGSGPGNAWLEIHPDYRHLEDAMLDWCEAHLAARTDEGRARLWLEAYEYDTLRQQLLARRGYVQQSGWGIVRWRAFDTPIPERAVPEGYVVRSLRPGDAGDTAGWAAASMAVFTHMQAADVEGYDARFQRSPFYRHDLHMICEAPDGTFAAFAGFTFEEVNHTAILEPVGTHPDHRRLGLAQAVIGEGLRRVKALGATVVYVGTGDDVAANRLYESLGFTAYDRCHAWVKMF